MPGDCRIERDCGKAVDVRSRGRIPHSRPAVIRECWSVPSASHHAQATYVAGGEYRRRDGVDVAWIHSLRRYSTLAVRQRLSGRGFSVQALVHLYEIGIVIRRRAALSLSLNL